MYTNVSMENNTNIYKRDELHNKSFNNRRTSSKYQNTFIHQYNSHVVMIQRLKNDKKSIITIHFKGETSF
jgi:hypothetical protein